MEYVVVKQVNDLNVNYIYPLVLESEREGFRFVRRFYDDYISGANRFDRNGEALFIAQRLNQVVGICGLNQDPYVLCENVGRVRRLYVHPNFRKDGVGRLLVSSVIDEAKRFYGILTLRTDNLVADKFYRTLGFSIDHTYKSETHFLPLGVERD